MRHALRTALCIAALSAAPSAQGRTAAPAATGTVRPFIFRAEPSSIRDSKATRADLKA
jgi:hypothetical protein